MEENPDDIVTHQERRGKSKRAQKSPE